MSIQEKREICEKYVAKKSLLGECEFIFAVNNNKNSADYEKIHLLYTLDKKYENIKIPDFVNCIGVDITFSVFDSDDEILEYTNELKYDIIPEINNNKMKKYLYAFTSIQSKEIIFGNNIDKIFFGSFKYATINKVTINKKLEYIGESAFSNNYMLKYINLEDLKINAIIKESAFEECRLLQRVNLENVKQIDACAFSMCKSLIEVVLPKTNEFKTIDELTFSSCIELKEIIIPENIEEIKEEAFFGANSIRNIIIEGSKIKIGNRAFYLKKDAFEEDCEYSIEREIHINKCELSNMEIDMAAFCYSANFKVIHKGNIMKKEEFFEKVGIHF